MRVREILFHNFRSFRGERRISFVDPLTGRVRPVTVLAGSNGSGKTTVLDAIEALLRYAQSPNRPGELVKEAHKTGLICLTLELTEAERDVPARKKSTLGEPEVVHVAVGRRDLAPRRPEEEWPNLICHLAQDGTSGKPYKRKAAPAEALRKLVTQMLDGQAELGGGWLFFPHDRRLSTTRGGAVEPPPEERQWLFRFSASDQWRGSLEQLWVWQHYLDLEQGTSSRSRLKPFVDLVEGILGPDRPITISTGRARVPTAWSRGTAEETRVRLDQLPSGEQQVLLLFGELARRWRKGAVIAIDEVENSLHPTLQRLVMWNLNRLAREWDAQVIVATHSLEVIRTARGGAFINLDYPDDQFDLPMPSDLQECVR